MKEKNTLIRSIKKTRTIKLPDSVVRHDDVNVRLAVQNLVRAVDAAKRGDVKDMATFIRLAHLFEQDIPNTIRLGVE